MLPESATQILRRFNAAGFAAFAVGGCVRDRLRGKPVHDIDITTAAHPQDVIALFADYQVIPTGIRHGTVTVLIDGRPFEITTFRTDGAYSDGRRPDNVRFGATLTDDLARRDFTVNAMAYHPDHGVIDPFGGQNDLKGHLLRCVGDPYTRFTEDALRIMRLLRFAAVLDFEIEPDTAAASHALRERLALVAAERKREELFRLLCGDAVERVALSFPDILSEIIPALSPLCGFDQQNPHHDFDIYTHTMRAVALTPAKLILRLSALFHDIGKPDTFTVDENGVGHFYGHPAVSERLAEEALRALKTDNRTIAAVLPLVRRHDIPLTPSKPSVRRLLSKLGREGLEELLQLKSADARACKADSRETDFEQMHTLHAKIRTLIQEIERDKDCMHMTDLAVNGHDLMALGIPAGKQLGEILRTLLDNVMAERCENTRGALLSLVKEKWL